jgi:NADH-quinone oxidoreductase subunit E
MNKNGIVELSPSVREQIDGWVAKYPADKKQSAVLSALMVTQENHGGWLTREHIDAVADYLQMPRIAAYEVATFYSMYDLKPVGRYKIGLCTNISCMLAGCDRIAEHLKKRLNIDFGETTADGRFTLKSVECLGACIEAPVIHLNKKYHEKLTPEKVDKILDELE